MRFTVARGSVEWNIHFFINIAWNGVTRVGESSSIEEYSNIQNYHKRAGAPVNATMSCATHRFSFRLFKYTAEHDFAVVYRHRC